MRHRQTRHARIGRSRAATLRMRVGSELRLARTAAGLTQRQLAGLVGVSQPFVSLVELGKRGADLRTACALASAAGSELSMRLFPAASVRLRDSGQLEAVQFIVGRAHPGWHPRIELPVGHDRRAADLVLVGAEQILHIEVERSLVDFQAQFRAAQLKRAALQEQLGRPTRLVIALPGTRRTRRILAEVLPGLGGVLPARTAAVWRAITHGSGLVGDGILLIPTLGRRR
jgi:HTH-type transcriptional regulator / antitoxin HipB